MVNVWKVGAWPGLWGKKPTKREDKVNREQKFISVYALPYNFVALGSAYVADDIRDLLSKNELRRAIIEGWKKDKGKEISSGELTARITMLTAFASISDGDVILLYFIGETPHNGEIYVGEASTEKNPYDYSNRVKTPYYYVKGSEENVIEDTVGIHIAPHRVGVKWETNNEPSKTKKITSFPADFSNSPYHIRIYQVLEKDLEKTIKDKEFRDFLKRKLKE